MTTKKERVIQNLYDIQKIDSWEDSGTFMAAVEGVLHFHGYKFEDIDDVREAQKEDASQHVSLGINSTGEDLIEYCPAFIYEDSEEAFCDLTNCRMSFDKFREICITYIDFTEK